MSSFSVDEIAPPSGGNAWDLQVGEAVSGTVTYVGKMPPRPSYDGKKREQSVRIDLDTGDGTTSVFVVINADVDGVPYPKRDARAVAAAVRAAGCTDLEVGGRLAIQRVEDVDTKVGKARDYSAVYKPPAAASPLAATVADEPPVTAPAPNLAAMLGD
jgi:hypothetical protein